jgi:hypothetical protein
MLVSPDVTVSVWVLLIGMVGGLGSLVVAVLHVGNVVSFCAAGPLLAAGALLMRVLAMSMRGTTQLGRAARRSANILLMSAALLATASVMCWLRPGAPPQ